MSFHRIAIIGATGQLGSELVRVLGERAIPLGHSQIELSDRSSVFQTLQVIRPDFVINAASYNWVDKAEEEPQAAMAINAFGPKSLAEACADRDIPLLHVSSDYVFGSKTRCTPYLESDPPGPISVYGQSKLRGEEFVRSLCPRHFVVRTCGLYGNADSVGKGNFVKTMLRLGRERGQVKVVNDQVCTPTATHDLARAIVPLIESQQYGLYHLTNQGETTWFDFAREIFRIAHLTVRVDPISTREFGAKAARPAYSVLNCDKAAAVIGRAMRPWQEAVEKYLDVS